jgi:hypothetical protein
MSSSHDTRQRKIRLNTNGVIMRDFIKVKLI